jgi:hypothetical protein
MLTDFGNAGQQNPSADRKWLKMFKKNILNIAHYLPSRRDANQGKESLWRILKLKYLSS